MYIFYTFPAVVNLAVKPVITLFAEEEKSYNKIIMMMMMMIIKLC